MTTLVSAPQYPIPGQACKITFTGLATGANFIRISPISAPIDSLLRKGIDAAKGELVEIHAGSSDTPWDFTPDKAGMCTLRLYQA